jgi:hypothetical protein
MKILKLLPVVVAVVLLSACGTKTSSVPYKTSSNLEIRMSDLQFLGETQISCEYNTYFGFIKSISKVNGEEYVPGNDVKLAIPSRSLINLSGKGMKLASTKLLKEFPDATYFMVVMDTKQTDVLFLGSTTVRTVKVRAYKFK